MESDTGEEVYEYVSRRLCLGHSSPGSPNSQADALLANPPRGGCFRASREPGTPVSPNAQTCPTRQERKPSPGLTTERLLCQDVGLSRKDEWGVGVLWCLTVAPCDVSEQLLTTETPPCGREKPIRPPRRSSPRGTAACTAAPRIESVSTATGPSGPATTQLGGIPHAGPSL